jgi:hypothetical protein
MVEVNAWIAGARRGRLSPSHPADWLWSSARWYLQRVAGPLAIDPMPAEWVDLGMSDG